MTHWRASHFPSPSGNQNRSDSQNQDNSSNVIFLDAQHSPASFTPEEMNGACGGWIILLGASLWVILWGLYLTISSLFGH